jgi:hypothetical protein
VQTSWTLRETLTSRPARNWTLDGNVVLTKFDSVGLSTLTYQTRGSVRTTWAPVPFVTFVGEWNLGRDDNQRSLSQRYSVRWSPGTKLSTVVSYYDFEARDVNKTANTSATLRYALLRGLDLFATLNRSVFEQTGLPTSERTNFRVGIDFIF